MTRSAGIVASASATRPVRTGCAFSASMRSRSVWYALGVGELLRDDPVERVPSLDRIPVVDENAERGMSVRSSTNCWAGTLTARSVARVPTSSTSPRDPDGLPQARRILPGAVSMPTRRERLLPLVAPDLQVDVDDVVVRDGDAAKRVRDRERARLVAGVEVPDDPTCRRGARRRTSRAAGLEARSVARARTRRRARPPTGSRATRLRGAGCRDSRSGSRPRTRPRGAPRRRASRRSGRRPPTSAESSEKLSSVGRRRMQGERDCRRGSAASAEVDGLRGWRCA